MSEASVEQPGLLVQIVTCRKSPAGRVASATRMLDGLGLDLDIEIVDGFVGEDALIDTLYDAAANPWRSKHPLSRTEVAVYASHRLAWRRLLDSGRRAALVLEDDFGLRDPALVSRVAQNWHAVLEAGPDIVKLFDLEKRGGPNRPFATHRVNGIELVKWSAPTAGMVAYLISRDGAEKFLARERIYRQVDEDTKYFWELGLDIWSVPGNPVTEVSADLGGSLVEDARRKAKRRSLLRSFWGNVLTARRKILTRRHLARQPLPRNG